MKSRTQLPAYHHPSCTGCPNCRADYRAQLSETSEQASRRLSAQTARVASEQMGRALARRAEPPNPYAAATDRAPYSPTANDDPRYAMGFPPNGYAIALAVRAANEQVKREDAAAGRGEPLSASDREALGGYADAIAKLRGANR